MGVITRGAGTASPASRSTASPEAYILSYKVIRLAVGFLGVLLPVFLILGETSLLRRGVHIEGSLSAYYHTSMQDLFVGDLSVIGVLLITYMAGESKTWGFWASLLAGFAVLGVVAFPTSRPGNPLPACGSHPEPAGCSPVEQALGEHTTAQIHSGCAIAFVVLLCVMSVIFALEVGLQMRVRFAVHIACAVVILVAGIWALWGADLGPVTHLYLGEVAAVSAFGISWLVAASQVA